MCDMLRVFFCTVRVDIQRYCATLATSVKNEIITCPVCFKDLKDPRLLPCLHSFCLVCLQGHCKDNCAGDEVECPLCRMPFNIPDNGPDGLKVSVFLQNLADAKIASTVKPDADGVETSGTAEPSKQRWRFCDKHPDRRLELYCFDCKCNICTKCFGTTHRQHQCEEIEKAAKDLAESMKSVVKPLGSHITEHRLAIAQIRAENGTFAAGVETAKCEILQAGYMLKRKVDRHVSELLQELEQIASSGNKEAETHEERFELNVMTMESFHMYAAELISKGSPYDVTSAADDVQRRAQELLQKYGTCDKYQAPKVTFEPSDLRHPATRPSDSQNTVGTLSVKKCPD